MKLHETITSNLDRVLKHWRVTPSGASVAAGWRKNYLNDAARGSYYSTNTIETIAGILGIQPHELADPDLDPEAIPEPAWLASCQRWDFQKTA